MRFNWNYPWFVLHEWLIPHEYTHARVWGRLQAQMSDHDAHFGVELMVVEAAMDSLPSYGAD